MSEKDVVALSWPAPVFGALDPSKWSERALDLFDSKSSLAGFDVPRELVQPVLGLLRQANTAADMLFYDVGVLGLRLLTRGFSVTTDGSQLAASVQDGMAAAQAAAKFINLSGGGAHESWRKRKSSSLVRQISDSTSLRLAARVGTSGAGGYHFRAEFILSPEGRPPKRAAFSEKAADIDTAGDQHQAIAAPKAAARPSSSAVRPGRGLRCCPPRWRR